MNLTKIRLLKNGEIPDSAYAPGRSAPERKAKATKIAVCQQPEIRMFFKALRLTSKLLNISSLLRSCSMQ